MARIAIGGWQHETNTFATIRADYEAFASADEWPAMVSGDGLVEAVRDVHLPIAGAIQVLEDRGHEIVPLLWCSATPCSYVTEPAYERIADEMLGLLERVMPVDAIYLDLHGAMVCEHLEDGEGEFLSRLRGLVGRDLPIFVSLDLHANVTPKMVDMATVLDIFRTYPHVDMGETGSRICHFLCDQLEDSRQIHKALRQIEFLIPLNTGCTLIEPCQSLYQDLPGLITSEVPSVSFACGFHLSDIYDVGPAVVAYGYDQKNTESAVKDLSDRIYANKDRFYQKIWPVQQGIEEARRVFKTQGKTVVIADTQDNPGGGGAGDTIGVLKAMVEQELENAAVGVINDSVVAAMAHEAGVGAEIDVEMGGRAGIAGQQTFPCRAIVRGLTDGRFTATGPMYHGAAMEIGDTALLQIGGVKVVVCSSAVQTADQEHFRHIGIEPGELNYVAVKSSVHFRNDYQQLASRILVVAAPGEVYADPSSLDYRNIRPGIEIPTLG
jgi:microcystin degradation protein MlrC